MNFSADSDEFENWSLGKLGDASLIFPVAALCKPNYFGEPEIRACSVHNTFRIYLLSQGASRPNCGAVVTP